MPTSSSGPKLHVRFVALWPCVPFDWRTGVCPLVRPYGRIGHAFGLDAGVADAGATARLPDFGTLRGVAGSHVGGAALLGSSLVGNSDLGGDESLWGLGAFVAAHGAYIALFGGGLFCAYETQRSGRCSMFHRLPLCCSLSCSMAGECRLPSFVSPCCS